MTVTVEYIESASLRDNCLGDPTRRALPVYTPPSYATDPDRRYPVVYLLHGFTGNALNWLNTNIYYAPTVPERYERMIRERGAGEMILVMVDGFNSYGGSQYMNSAATGNYEDYVVGDIIPFIDRSYRTIATREGRGVAGKSSGGYGALRLGMRRPDIFGALASHAGDTYFEYCYKPDFPKVVNGVATYHGTPDPVNSFITEFMLADQKRSKDIEVMNVLGMAACYSPRDPSKIAMTERAFDLPFDIHTGEMVPDVWARWLENDPVYMLDTPTYRDALRDFALVYLDAGIYDEYNLHLGARIFTGRLKAHNIAHHHEEFDAGHMNINYRYDVSLAALAKALRA